MRLRLGGPPLFASQRLMPHLPELRALHPSLHIDIDTGAHVFARLDEGLDAAIAIAPEVDPSLYSRRIDSNRVIAIGARELAEGPAALTHPSPLPQATVFVHRTLPRPFRYSPGARGPPHLPPPPEHHS